MESNDSPEIPDRGGGETSDIPGLPSGEERRENVLLRGQLCADSYSVEHPVLPQWHVEDSDHSAKMQVAYYTLICTHREPVKPEWADYAAVQA